jgi:hypothetical protein
MLNPFVANRPADANHLALTYCTLFRLKNQVPNLTPSLRFAACALLAESSQLPKRFFLPVR